MEGWLVLRDTASTCLCASVSNDRGRLSDTPVEEPATINQACLRHDTIHNHNTPVVGTGTGTGVCRADGCTSTARVS